MFHAKSSVAGLSLTVAVVLSCFLLTGCGGPDYEGPERAPVTGAVTMDGTPVVHGVISFVPQGDGRRASGLIVKGTYTIKEEMGPNPGEYKVQILGYGMAPGEGDTVPSATSDEEGDTEEDTEGKSDDAGPQIIPPKYNTQSELTVTIKSGENPHDFTLTNE